MWEQIAEQVTQVTGKPFTLVQQRSIGGGCINRGSQIEGDRGQTYFVKFNAPTQVEMFAAEALGLQQMQAVKAIRVPTPICWGTAEGAAYLVMEWLDLGGGGTQAWGKMGQRLAQLHRNGVSAKGFGWDRNNTIGSTPQLNFWTGDWATFFVEHRIGYQLKLGRRNGGQFPQGQRLLAQIPDLLAGHEPQPSLVHGDLWSGNAAISRSGEPIIFDPAVYYGDREVDLAMSELFGRFSPEFYRAYEATWPLEPGYERRKILYNLYHILNHFNLFGGGYESQANRMIEQLVG